jgi:hypothetical protein
MQTSKFGISEEPFCTVYIREGKGQGYICLKTPIRQLLIVQVIIVIRQLESNSSNRHIQG